jgi:hypothetical protein
VKLKTIWVKLPEVPALILTKGSDLTIDTILRGGSFRSVPRKVKVKYEEAIYHMMNCGDRRETIFTDDTDREIFLTALGESCAKTDSQVHALCLLSNHFHLVVETAQRQLFFAMCRIYSPCIGKKPVNGTVVSIVRSDPSMTT